MIYKSRGAYLFHVICISSDKNSNNTELSSSVFLPFHSECFTKHLNWLTLVNKWRTVHIWPQWRFLNQYILWQFSEAHCFSSTLHLQCSLLPLSQKHACTLLHTDFEIDSTILLTVQIFCWETLISVEPAISLSSIKRYVQSWRSSNTSQKISFIHYRISCFLLSFSWTNE